MKILLVDIVWSSLRWLLEAASIWIWKHSIVLRWRTFFWHCRTCITSWIFPKECMCSFKFCANLEVWLLFQKEGLCSLYLIIKSNLSVLCKPSYNRDMLVYTLRKVKICLGSGYCVLSGFVRYYLYGRLFLYLSAWMCW